GQKAKRPLSRAFVWLRGQDLAFLSRGVGFASLRAPDDSSNQPATVSQIQEQPGLSRAVLVSGCGDRI
ncbi:hypothetical protein, partial [Mesorhizobium sp. WSM3859]|uniref:hypothetical protein n=1 Tax=Mesorhizobium sp. WSM3859 TaxID=2029402 RepID=UPI001AED05EA